MLDLNDSIHTYLTTAPASGFAGRAVTMRVHWRGENSLLWRVEADGAEAVVKLFLDAGQARGRRQFDGQQMFAPQGVAPEPLWFDRYPEGLARQVLVYRWVEGRNVDVGNLDDLAALAASVAAVHNGEASAVRRISPRAVNLDYFWRVLAGGLAPTTSWLEAVGCLHLAELVHALTTRAAAIVAEARLLWQSATPTPVHGDLRLEHALMQGRRAVLLDWEMFGLGDPALDVATFLRQDAGTMDDASRAHWLACYCDAVRSPELSARIDVYARLLPLQQFAFLLGGLRQLTPSDRHDPDLRNNMAFLRQTLAATGEAAAANLLTNAAMPLNEIDHLMMAVAQT